MMKTKFLKLGRTFKEGGVNFYRNGWLSFATVSILTVSLYIISFTIIAGIVTSMVLKSVQEKVNVSVYFNADVPEQKILEIKDILSSYSEIRSIAYVTKEAAFEDLKKMKEKNKTIEKALDALDGENPLLGALEIKAKDPETFPLIARSIRSSSFNELISDINYEDNQDAIEKLNAIIRLLQKVGTTIGIVFVFIGILITFNAIRLTMYSQKHEFEVKRLVGASNTYIQMPFVFEGILYGIVSASVVMLLLGVTMYYAAPLAQGNISAGGLMGFYWKHFFSFLGSLLLSGVFLGVISSFIAIRRYLKV